MRFYLCLLAFFLSFISAKAQTDTADAHLLFEQASQLHDDGEYASSATLFTQAAQAFRQAKVDRREVETLLRSGDSWIRDTQFEQGEAQTTQAKELLPSLSEPHHMLSGRVAMNRGLLALYASAPQEAKAAYKQAILSLTQARNVDHLLATCYNDLGVVAGMNGNYQEELTRYQQALDLQLALYGEQHTEVAGTYNNIGTAYFRLGDFAAMDNYLRKAEVVLIGSYGETHPYMATIYNNIAYSSQLTEQYDESIRYYQKALTIHGLTREERHALVSVTYNNMAETYGKMGQRQEQLLYHQKALSLRLSVLGRLHNDVAISYQNLGHTYGILGDSVKEYDSFSQALAIRQELLGDRHPEVASTYLSLSELYRRRGEMDSAFQFLQRSYRANTFAFSSDSPDAVPPLDESFSYPLLLEQLTVHALHREAIAGQTGTVSDWLSALAVWVHADSLVWQRRSGIIDPNGLSYLGRESRAVYEGGIRCAATILEEKFSTVAANALVKFLVRSRAGQLWESWHAAPTAQAFGLSAASLEEENRLRTAIEQAELLNRQALADSGRSSQAFVKATEQVFDARKNWEQFILKLNSLHPGYVSQRYQRPEMTWNSFRTSLGEDIAIAFFLTENQLYRFGFQMNKIHVSHSPLDAEMHTRISTALRALQQPTAYDPSIYEDAASALITELLTPVLWELSPGPETDIIIVPDGILGYLPMEALGTKEGEAFTYFSHDQPIRYQYGLTGSPLSETEPRMVFAGFAPDYPSGAITDSRGEFSPLTHNVQEVEKALDIIKDGAIWKGGDATESRFKQVAPEAKILHLAMHGRLDDHAPSTSFLAFAPDAEEDGRLYAYEISAMTLHADLAVLSACQTGSGLFQQGEGIMSLARAFQEAGCRSVIMSLWSVNDEATYEFMTRFYTFWNQGYSSSRSLMMTREAMQSETRFRSPHYWAGFVLVGDSVPIPGSKSRWPWAVAGFVAALLAFILYSRRRAKTA